MTRRSIWLVAALVSTLSSAIAGAGQLPPAGLKQDAADDGLRVTERATSGTPEYYFQRAWQKDQDGDRQTAGRELRRGIALLKEETKTATANGKIVLQRSIVELENMADSLQQGVAVSAIRLRSAFARASHALAYHYQQRGNESWLRQKYKRAGEDFKAASNNVEYGISWIGERVETKSQDVLQATREFGDALIAGAKSDAQQVRSRVTILGGEIKRFGRRVLKPVAP